MNDTSFMELAWWVLSPLVGLFALWAQLDCLRSPVLSRSQKFGFCLLILLVPIWGGVIWFRWKESHRADQSDLMRRVMRRRGKG